MSAPASADLPMIMPDLTPPPEHPTWAVCSETTCDGAQLRKMVEGFWECPRCRFVRHESTLERLERNTSTDKEIAECWREDVHRGERGGGGSRSKRYGQREVARGPSSWNPESGGSGTSGKRDSAEVAEKLVTVKVRESTAGAIAELSRQLSVSQVRLWDLVASRGLEVLRQEPFCSKCGGGKKGEVTVVCRGCCCE